MFSFKSPTSLNSKMSVKEKRKYLPRQLRSFRKINFHGLLESFWAKISEGVQLEGKQKLRKKNFWSCDVITAKNLTLSFIVNFFT